MKAVVRWIAVGLRVIVDYLLVTVVCLLLVVLAGVGALLVLTVHEKHARYDRDGADYKYITGLIVEGHSTPGLTIYDETPVDLRKINGGDWQVLCIIGPYNDPVEILESEAKRRGIQTTLIDAVPTPWLGITPVEEYEGAISFLDREGRGKTVLVDGFERLAAQHDHKCFVQGTAEIVMPISNSSGP